MWHLRFLHVARFVFWEDVCSFLASNYYIKTLRLIHWELLYTTSTWPDLARPVSYSGRIVFAQTRGLWYRLLRFAPRLASGQSNNVFHMRVDHRSNSVKAVFWDLYILTTTTCISIFICFFLSFFPHGLIIFLYSLERFEVDWKAQWWQYHKLRCN